MGEGQTSLIQLVTAIQLHARAQDSVSPIIQDLDAFHEYRQVLISVFEAALHQFGDEQLDDERLVSK